MTNVLALDIGGTNCRLMMMDEFDEEHFRCTIPTNPSDVRSMAEAILAELKRRGGVDQIVDAIGVAVAGNVENGVMTGSGNLPGWTNRDLAAEFRLLADRPIAVVNDCAAAALGEYTKFQQPLVYVIWGTGVGASVVTRSGERVIVKPTELGHMIIDLNSRAQCGCGGYGHLEALVGGRNLERNSGVAAGSMSDTQWTTVLKGLAAGLRSISCAELGLPIVLGGGVIHKQQQRLPELQELVTSCVAPAAVPFLSLAQLGEDSGLFGAAESAFRLLSV